MTFPFAGQRQLRIVCSEVWFALLSLLTVAFGVGVVDTVLFLSTGAVTVVLALRCAAPDGGEAGAGAGVRVDGLGGFVGTLVGRATCNNWPGYIV